MPAAVSGGRQTLFFVFIFAPAFQFQSAFDAVPDSRDSHISDDAIFRTTKRQNRVHTRAGSAAEQIFSTVSVSAASLHRRWMVALLDPSGRGDKLRCSAWPIRFWKPNTRPLFVRSKPFYASLLAHQLQVFGTWDMDIELLKRAGQPHAPMSTYLKRI
ncbi:hypothetical protein C8J57DRAFT_1237146 [Mycena rebaudengoi]|nr:hypothetical protein C8J57DRAFT_1237146 [Mycena rebaudengoi]